MNKYRVIAEIEEIIEADSPDEAEQLFLNSYKTVGNQPPEVYEEEDA